MCRRVLVLLSLLVAVSSISLSASAQLPVGAQLPSATALTAVPGTRVRVALPNGCTLSGRGGIACGHERIDVGGSALGFEELRAAHVAAGHVVMDLPQVPLRTLVIAFPDGRVLFVSEHAGERLLLTGRSSRAATEAGVVYARVLLAIQLEPEGDIVTGAGGLDRARIPYPTVSWHNDMLEFYSDGVQTSARVVVGHFREESPTSMTELCQPAEGIGQGSRRLILNLQRALEGDDSLCQSAVVIEVNQERVLTAKFGVIRGGVGHVLVMVYTLDATENVTTCLTGFEHFAVPALMRLMRAERDEPAPAASPRRGRARVR